ncbi:MAG: hypothetical protein AVDCRST_MAG21-1774, partial [uncultured Nocardioidaceae bacterium]
CRTAAGEPIYRHSCRPGSSDASRSGGGGTDRQRGGTRAHCL